MKRYLLFAGQHYEARGGWSDFHASYDTIDEAMKEYLHYLQQQPNKSHGWEWFEIIDSETEEVVLRGGTG